MLSRNKFHILPSKPFLAKTPYQEPQNHNSQLNTTISINSSQLSLTKNSFIQYIHPKPQVDLHHQQQNSNSLKFHKCFNKNNNKKIHRHDTQQIEYLPPNKRIVFKSKTKPPNKSIKLQDRTYRKPYPDSRPPLISNIVKYSVCQVPSPAFVRSGVTGQCKVTKLGALVNITEYGTGAKNNSFYSHQKLQSVCKMRSRSRQINSKIQRNTLNNYQNQHSTPERRLNRMLSQDNLFSSKLCTSNYVSSPFQISSRIQFQNTNSQYTAIDNFQSRILAQQRNFRKLFSEISNEPTQKQKNYTHQSSNRDIDKSFDNLKRLMQQSLSIQNNLTRNNNQNIYNPYHKTL